MHANVFLQVGKNVKLFHRSAAASGGAIFTHVDTPDNNPSTPFDFTDENYKVMRFIYFFV